MAEYIDLEAILREIERRERLMVGDKTISVDALKRFILNRPAADVAPVVHGRWVDRIVDENEVIQPWMKRYYCSECLEGGNQSWFKFCPNCGAKMDGGDSDEAD